MSYYSLCQCDACGFKTTEHHNPGWVRISLEWHENGQSKSNTLDICPDCQGQTRTLLSLRALPR